MIEAIYQMYVEQKRRLQQQEDFQSDEMLSIIADTKLDIALLEEKCPEYKKRYERQLAIQKSFTREQQDFICWQIGEWYFHMKSLLEGQHNLGHKKELLKTMICGDE